MPFSGDHDRIRDRTLNTQALLHTPAIGSAAAPDTAVRTLSPTPPFLFRTPPISKSGTLPAGWHATCQASRRVCRTETGPWDSRTQHLTGLPAQCRFPDGAEEMGGALVGVTMRGHKTSKLALLPDSEGGLPMARSSAIAEPSCWVSARRCAAT